MEYQLITPPSKTSRIIVKSQAEKGQDPLAVRYCKETVSSGYIMTTAEMNSQKLIQHVLDMCRLKPDEITT